MEFDLKTEEAKKINKSSDKVGDLIAKNIGDRVKENTLCKGRKK